MLVMPRLIGWQGGKHILQRKGSHKKQFFFPFIFSFSYLKQFQHFFFKRSSNVVTKSKCED
jgi:hypothetical protein